MGFDACRWHPGPSQGYEPARQCSEVRLWAGCVQSRTRLLLNRKEGEWEDLKPKYKKELRAQSSSSGVAKQGGEWPEFPKMFMSWRAKDLAAFYSHVNGATFIVL